MRSVMTMEWRGSVMHAYLHCRGCEQRLRRVVQAAIFPGSRKRAPGILRSQRGVTQSIPIDGLVATPWSAVDRGTARADSRHKSLRSSLKRATARLSPSPQSEGGVSGVRLQAEYPNTFLYRCNWLEARTGTALRLSPKDDRMT